MAQVAAIFWDVGGVLLTNAWDHNERRAAVAQFRLDATEFERRHESVISDFETGKMALNAYLQHSVFYEHREFTPQAFRQFMLEQSRANAPALGFARGLAASQKYLMGTINNESRELNEFRIRTFQLGEIFDIFVSSCFVGIRKPDTEIYKRAIDLTQRAPEECCFIDDRPENLEPARQLGFHTVHMQGVEHLREKLQEMGVTA